MATSEVLDSNMRLRTEVARLRAVADATRSILMSQRHHSDDDNKALVSAAACERAYAALNALDEDFPQKG